MPNKTQLSAGEAFDDQTGHPLGEGFLMLNTSAGNRVVFRSPAEMHNYIAANRGAFARAALDNGTGGDYNMSDDVPTTT